MVNILNKLFDFNKKELKRLEKLADKVEALADQMANLSDEELKANTPIHSTMLIQVKRHTVIFLLLLILRTYSPFNQKSLQLKYLSL